MISSTEERGLSTSTVRWAGVAGMLGGALGKTGAVVAAVGAALPVIGGLVQGLLYDGDYPLMPYFVIPGLLALVVGFVLLGIAVLLVGVLPRWAAALLVVGALAMPQGSTTRTRRPCWRYRTASRGSRWGTYSGPAGQPNETRGRGSEANLTAGRVFLRLIRPGVATGRRSPPPRPRRRAPTSSRPGGCGALAAVARRQLRPGA
jgi:hypothetical protein